MWDWIARFFENQTLSPHGICLLWRPELIWTHAVSDVLIGLAYFSIPLALGVFLYHRRDVRFGWAVWLFVLFIMLCGVTHFMMVWTLWNADYGVEALIKAATALASLITAIALWPLLPKAIAIPSAATLQARIDERDRALDELRGAMASMMEMREHQARQKLLLDELNHRVKNTLASVQSIANATLRAAPEPGEFRTTFMERLMALSATHDLLVRHEWERASFHELARSVLGHYGRPYEVSGPDLSLDPNFAVTFGMALHELATNALKYGAWVGEGRVELTVEDTAQDQLCIVWREIGGPPVRPPRQRGFGSRLLERGVKGEIGGEIELDFRSEGLVCRICAPASARMRRADRPSDAPA